MKTIGARTKPELEGLTRLQVRCKAIEEELGDDGRVLLRYSGTEPLVRIMVEGLDKSMIEAQAEELASILREEIGAEPA